MKFIDDYYLRSIWNNSLSFYYSQEVLKRVNYTFSTPAPIATVINIKHIPLQQLPSAQTQIAGALLLSQLVDHVNVPKWLQCQFHELLYSFDPKPSLVECKHLRDSKMILKFSIRFVTLDDIFDGEKSITSSSGASTAMNHNWARSAAI